MKYGKACLLPFDINIIIARLRPGYGELDRIGSARRNLYRSLPLHLTVYPQGDVVAAGGDAIVDHVSPDGNRLPGLGLGGIDTDALQVNIRLSQICRRLCRR